MCGCAASTAASTGAPRESPGCPLMPNRARSTASGIVRRSEPSRSYTVTECWYSMFCANARQAPDAATDFGEMAPVIVRTKTSRKSSAGSCGTVVELDVVRGTDLLVVGAAAWVGGAGPSSAFALAFDEGSR